MGASYRCDTGQKQVAESQTATFSLEVAGERCVCSRVPLAGHLGQPCKINIPPSHQLAAHGSLVTKRDTDDATAAAGQQSPRNVSRLNDDGRVETRTAGRVLGIR